MSEPIPGPYSFNFLAINGISAEVEIIGDHFELPARRCDLCGEYTRHRQLARYDLDVPERLDRKSLCYSSGWAELSIDEFERLTKQFNLSEDDPAKVIPGMKIGRPVLRLTTPARDFVSDGLVILVSEQALECFHTCSVNVRVAPVDVLDRKNKRIKYFNILTPVLKLADENWMSLECVQCPKCLEWWKKTDVRSQKQVQVDKAKLVKSRWPEGQGVVYSSDICGVYYSPEFVQACLKSKLTGTGFKQVFWV